LPVPVAGLADHPGADPRWLEEQASATTSPSPHRTDRSFTVVYFNPRATDDVLAMVREQMPAGWRLLSLSRPTEFARELGECDFLVVADRLALAPKSAKNCFSVSVLFVLGTPACARMSR
jgi:hypothetical protein